MGILLLIVLGIIPGAWGGEWRVTFRNQCALRGTSVVMKCEFDYPGGHIVTAVHWLRASLFGGKWSLHPLSPKERFRYVGNRWEDCSLEINNVQHDDDGAYAFQFTTTLSSGYRSRSFAYLSVQELTAIIQNSTVTEGDTVTLTCVSGCRTPVDTVWYRDGVPEQRTVFQATREDAGRYHCALRGQTNIRSASVTLNIQYPPKKVKVQVSPSTDIITGNSVTFICSSEANPPVAPSGYSLYKDGLFISVGERHTIPALQPSHSGSYYCRAQNGVSRWKVSIRSAGVHLNVQYSPVNVSISMNATLLVEGSSVNLSCSGNANPAPHEYTWYRSTGPGGNVDLVGQGEVLSLPSLDVSHTGFYLCGARNRLGESNSTEVLLAVPVKQHGSLAVIAGVGVSLLVTLVLALLLFWRKKRAFAEKKTLHALGGDRSPSVSEDQSSRLYINMSLLSTRPALAPDNDYEEPESYASAITYSTVNFIPRNSRRHSRALQDSQSSSVIYSTVAEATRV